MFYANDYNNNVQGTDYMEYYGILWNIKNRVKWQRDKN